MFKINDNLDIVTYGAAVREIADKFFDGDGNYAPHIGKANAMVVFYNYFVAESKFAEMPAEEFTTDLFFSDEEFLSEYNKALKNCAEVRFNFGVVEQFEKAIINLSDKISPILSGETIDKIAKISDDVTKGNLSAESVVKALGNR